MAVHLVILRGMILGILSDTHGRAAIAAKAIGLLKARGAEYFVHCGDVGEGVLEVMPFEASAFVFGNNDYDRHYFHDTARERRIACLDHRGILSFDGKSIAITHGDDSRILNELVASKMHDYVLSGHTHVPHDIRVGNTRRINPGALYRAARKTVATLDLANDLLTQHVVEEF